MAVAYERSRPPPPGEEFPFAPPRVRTLVSILTTTRPHRSGVRSGSRRAGVRGGPTPAGVTGTLPDRRSLETFALYGIRSVPGPGREPTGQQRRSPVYYVPLWMLALFLPVSALAVYLGLRDAGVSRGLLYFLTVLLSPVLLLGAAFAAVVASTALSAALEEPAEVPDDPPPQREATREPTEQTAPPATTEPTQPAASPSASSSASSSA